MNEKNKFISALNLYFGYEIQNTQQFYDDFTSEFHLAEQGEKLLDFLEWYERELSK